MAQVKWVTPNKAQKCDSPLLNSPRLNKIPIEQNENRSKHTAYQSNVGHFNVLPNRITTPSGLKKFIGKNPFEADLTSRLHLSMISPTIFTKISSPPQQLSEFTWSIDELARIKPAKIEDSPLQQIHSPDPDVEKQAQAAIDRFFKENQIIPSPWEERRKEDKLNIDPDTPCRHLDDLHFTKESSKLKKNAWSQTVLSLPLNLPENVEEALKSFFTFTQEQNVDNDDVNSSNSSLRRKLFFNHDEEGIDNDDESFISLSPVKIGDSMMLPCSPPQSGIFIHGTPLQRSYKIMQRTEESFMKSGTLSPPNMSPIHENEDDILYKRIECRSGSVLNFTTDFHLDNVISEDDCGSNENSDKEYLLDISVDNDENDYNLKIVSNNKTNLYDSVNMDISTVTVDNTVHSVMISNDKKHSDTNLDILTDITKNSMYTSHKQNNAMSSAFDAENISNSVQDTGYQTYSMNSITHNTVDSYNNTSVNCKDHWEEQIATFKDDQLSWKENIRNVFSSTPSKSSQEGI